jgi:hypothetical protein
MEPTPSKVTKTYPPRGPLQQFRLEDAVAFRCFRCGDTKKAKLHAIYRGDWSRQLCNGCYGRLLSLFEIKAGTTPDDEKADALAEALLAMVAAGDQANAERLLRASDERAKKLTPAAVRFIATAEHVAGALESYAQLEWSPAIIGLCKALEAEIVFRILRPLAQRSATTDLSTDKADKDLGRIALFCIDQSRKPPELGVFAHFLQTAIHSQQRRDTSPLIRCFMALLTGWTGSQWLLDPDGLHRALVAVTVDFRNRAAHIEELSSLDYAACRDAVLGKDGALWKLLVATEGHK